MHEYLFLADKHMKCVFIFDDNLDLFLAEKHMKCVFLYSMIILFFWFIDVEPSSNNS